MDPLNDTDHLRATIADHDADGSPITVGDLSEDPEFYGVHARGVGASAFQSQRSQRTRARGALCSGSHHDAV